MDITTLALAKKEIEKIVQEYGGIPGPQGKQGPQGP